MKKLLVLFCSLALLASCGISKKSYQHAPASIKMSMGPCFGQCPVYDIEITGDGKAAYTGKHFVEKMGEFAKTFSPEETNTLFKRFKDANFWDYADEYTAEVTDLPTVYITYADGKRSKKVMAYFDVPESLRDLIKLVHDNYAESAGWTATITE